MSEQISKAQPGQLEAFTAWLANHPAPLDTTPGTFYKVPCARFLSSWQQSPAWLPLIGPVHEDRDVIQFQPDHVHIDTRFLPKLKGRRQFVTDLALPLCLTTDQEHYWHQKELQYAVKLRKCRRDPLQWDTLCIKWIPLLEEVHAGCRIGPDGLCPHRGIPLGASPVLADGSRVCVGHGLRWAADGSLIRRGDCPTGAALPVVQTDPAP